MARRGSDTPTIPRRRNATVAAATRIKLDERKTQKAQASKRAEWQAEAWDYFDDVPEIKYATWYSGNVISKLRLFIATQPDPEAAPIAATDPESGIPAALAQRAEAELARLHGDLGGLPEILRSLTMNLDIAAEAYIVGLGPRTRTEPDPSDPSVELVIEDPEDWFVASIDEVKLEGSAWKYQTVEGGWEILDPDRDTIIRAWQRHPRNRNRPDNNMRGILSDCEALLLLTNQVKAEAKSKQSAGILAVPNELSFGPDQPSANGNGAEPDEGEEAETDSFTSELLSALTDPIADPSSAAAVMPLVLRGPGDEMTPDKLRHIKLDRGDATSVLEDRISARVTRIARGINLPVEIVMGHQQTTFANAEQVDEDTFEDHFEPRALLLVDILTVGFLRPQLDDAGVDPALVDQLFVWFDPTAVIGTPDLGESADVGLDRGVISEEAWRRVKGWTEDDAPDAMELLIRSGLRRGILTADLTKALLELLGVPIEVEPLPEAAPVEAPAAAAAEMIRTAMLMAAARGKPFDWSFDYGSQPAITAARKPHRSSLDARRDAGRRVGAKLAAIDRELRTRLLVAANAALTRALEKAGNKLRSAAGPTRQQLKSTLPLYAAATLGPTLTAQAGFAPDDLISPDQWAGLEQQFMEWGANAQAEAMEAASQLAGFTQAERQALGLRQVSDLREAWDWMKEALTALGRDRLFAPDGATPEFGEFDPTSRVPTGLVREAIARAGGARGIEPVGDNLFVAVHNGGQPLGGIGTGELLSDAMASNGVETEAYEWDYGSAYRQAPFQEHLDLHGTVFADFSDRQLNADASWVAGSEYFPGDHAGCACDFVVILIAPEDFGQTTQGPNG